ncbi:hypothetical protein Ctob_006380 [Chrysochromulina tobinii]|uniref:Uncharacterized protein n=1 Tax=Chrysochromulina tobinii TaxID=1460289 RepID=A0A0M0JR18_9EUKA|nr:hypothetical protein Ctob_006380 [Chrysochromulina tobinii]|eukprot:KOO29031.1 hypothetical protein Ctob_006380 [Chrysochromulina sp. CCMP291]
MGASELGASAEMGASELGASAEMGASELGASAEMGASKPGKSRLLQKYLLANLFLRAAASLGPRFDFVGRSEDDALVDAAAAAAHLHSVRARVAGPILYGVKGEWVMWAPATMMPLCWAMTLRRWEVQKRRDETLARDVAARHPPPPRASNQSATLGPAGECHAANLGPSLLVKGPLVVYSAELLQALVSARAFDSDEARVRSSWDRIKTERLRLELLQRPTAPRLGVVHAPLAEDVYYATLLGTALSHRSLTFVTVPMAEYAWNTPPSREPTLGRLPSAAVYHRLSPGRLNASGLSDGQHLFTPGACACFEDTGSFAPELKACFEDAGSFAPELKVVSSSSDPELGFGAVAANAGSGSGSAVTVTIAAV